jgi:hypothetical protein
MFATEPKKRIRNHVTISKTDSVITKRPGPLHRVTVTGLPAGIMLQLPTANSALHVNHHSLPTLQNVTPHAARQNRPQWMRHRRRKNVSKKRMVPATGTLSNDRWL